MKQNKSHAVMQQRHEPHDSLDDFPSPSWAVRGFVEYVLLPHFPQIRDQKVWEVAANRGCMAKPLAEYFNDVYASDIHDYGWEGLDKIEDFLFPGSEDDVRPIDWVITNPPFRLCEQFIEKASNIAEVGYAFLVRTSFIEGVGRYNNIYRNNPPTIVAQYTERVGMARGKVSPDISTATSYAWVVWIKDKQGQPTELKWIPPCRKEFEKSTDYILPDGVLTLSQTATNAIKGEMT